MPISLSHLETARVGVLDQMRLFDILSFDDPGAPLQYCSAGMMPARIRRRTVAELRLSILAASVNVTSPRAANSPSL